MYMRLRDYIMTTSTVNRIEQAVWYHDKEHSDIHFPDGGSIKDYIEIVPEADNSTAVVDLAIVNLAIAI